MRNGVEVEVGGGGSLQATRVERNRENCGAAGAARRGPLICVFDIASLVLSVKFFVITSSALSRRGTGDVVMFLFLLLRVL